MRRCAGKIRHPDQATAEQHRRDLARRGKTPMDKTNSYRCNQCLGYHVGHTARRFQRSRRRR